MTHGLINRMVFWTDIVIVAATLALAPWNGGLLPAQRLLLAVVETVAYAALMQHYVAYRVEYYTRLLWPLGTILLAVVGAWLAGSGLLIGFAPSAYRASHHLLPGNGLVLGLLVAARQGARWSVRQVNARKLLRRNVVVIGSGETADRVIQSLNEPSEQEYHRLMAVFNERLERCGPPNGDLRDLAALVRDNMVDVVMIGLPLSRATEIATLVDQVQWISADVVIPFPFAEAGVQPHVARIVRLGLIAGLLVAYRPFKGSEGLLKVAEDYVVACLALVLTSPIMLLAAIAIRLESKGPVLFRQDRTGFNSQNFTIYKFRTMTTDPGDDGTLGTRGRFDPRITRVGRFLRNTSIDELPQLINVLKGEMSVVGPRPYVPGMLVGDEPIVAAVNHYAARHRIKPGITGWAQSKGLRGGALRDVDVMRRSVEMDMYYITHWSIWFDLRIMLRTIVAGMSGKNVF